MGMVRLIRPFACAVAFSCVGLAGMFAQQARATNEYFDVNGTGTGSGVASGGSYTFEATTGTGGWNTTSTGLTTATTAWVDGNNFMRFSAGTDAAALNFTVTANTNHTFAGMALQTNGGGTVTIASSGGAVMNLFSSSNGQGFFVGGVSSQNLQITAPIGGDSITPLVWSGLLSGTASGSLYLYGNNTFQGGVQLNTTAGLNFNNANSFGNGGTITWGAAGSTGTSFTVAAPALAADITIANPMLARNATGTGATTNLTIGNLNGHKVTWSGGLTLVTGVASSITTNSTVTTEFSGVITGTDATKAFTKSGVGTLILSNAGNSYAGQTTIGNGILSAPGIGNSGSNSPLGKNGTINLGATTTAGNLTYTGSGETSDKVLNLAGTTGGGVIDQSGTGLLKFTSDMTAGGVGAKTLTLQGSTAGTGEIAAKIVDNGGANTTAVTKAGTGTWTLSAANTYTGGTTISAGVLNVGNNSALGGGLLTIGGGTIAASGGSRTIANNAIISTGNGTVGGANDFTFGGSFTNSTGSRTLTVSNTGLTTFGTVDLSEATGTGRTLTITGAGNTTFGGVIENFSGGGGTAGNLTFNTGYTGTATINGANTYSGTTTLSTGGTFVLGNKAAFGTSTVAINGVSISASTNLSGANAIANATVNLGGDNNFTGSNSIEFTGTVTETSSRKITNNLSAGNLTFSGPVNLSSNGTNNTLTVTGSGSTLISGVIANGGTSTSSKLSIGGGVVTLTGANTYGIAGVTTTTVSGGKLLVNNITGSGTGSGDVLVNGGRLGGTGHIDGNVSVTSGGLSPGASINHLDIGGNLSMTGGSYDYEINSTTATADLTTVVGNLSLAGVALSASELGSGMLAMGTKFTLINYGGTWDSGIFNSLPNYSTTLVIGANRFAIQYDDTTGGGNFGGGTYGGGVGPHFVTITAVPEPSEFLTVGLGGIFAIAAIWMSKRFGVFVLKV